MPLSLPQLANRLGGDRLGIGAAELAQAESGKAATRRIVVLVDGLQEPCCNVRWGSNQAGHGREGPAPDLEIDVPGGLQERLRGFDAVGGELAQGKGRHSSLDGLLAASDHGEEQGQHLELQGEHHHQLDQWALQDQEVEVNLNLA